MPPANGKIDACPVFVMTGPRAGPLAPRALIEMAGSGAGHDGVQSVQPRPPTFRWHGLLARAVGVTSFAKLDATVAGAFTKRPNFAARDIVVTHDGHYFDTVSGFRHAIVRECRCLTNRGLL